MKRVTALEWKAKIFSPHSFWKHLSPWGNVEWKPRLTKQIRGLSQDWVLGWLLTAACNGLFGWGSRAAGMDSPDSPAGNSSSLPGAAHMLWVMEAPWDSSSLGYCYFHHQDFQTAAATSITHFMSSYFHSPNLKEQPLHAASKRPGLRATNPAPPPPLA